MVSRRAMLFYSGLRMSRVGILESTYETSQVAGETVLHLMQSFIAIDQILFSGVRYERPFFIFFVYDKCCSPKYEYTVGGHK